MIVTLLTDFGTSDHYVGVMKGVLLGVDERIRVVDLSHEVPAGGVDTGAFLLLAAYRHFPPGTVHVGVVDPGVGTARRAVVVEAAGQLFVGPDNGLFSYLLDREAGAGVREVIADRFVRRPASTTFHGRDLFAPLGAALATGVRWEEVGPLLTDPVRLPALRPTVAADGGLLGRILHVDRFGNCITSIGREDVVAPNDGVRLRVAGREIAEVRSHYAGAAPGRPFLVWGSSDFLEVSVNDGSAAALLRVSAGTAVEARVVSAAAGGAADGGGRPA